MKGPSDIATNRPSSGLGGVALDVPSPRASEPPPYGGPDEFKGVRRLIWLYFWLLMTEGILRKWVFPGLSNPLLVVRDPILLLCYIAALRQGAFPRTVFLPMIVCLAVAACLFSVTGIATGTSRSNYLVLLYGLRASFAHLPLIFVIGTVFTRRDVERVGKWLLGMAVPMALLVLLQYKGGHNDRVNVGVGGIEGGQITVAVPGFVKVRPPGVFSDNTGLTAYLGLVFAFLLAHFFAREKPYKRWVGIAAGGALVACIPLALSRSTVGVVTIVAGTGVLCLFFRPELFSKGLTVGLLLLFCVVIAGRFAIFNQGIGILGARFEVASGIKVGIVDRMIGLFTAPLDVLSSARFLGEGLGVGTNVGARLITGAKGFLLAEGEWERDVLEMGPLVGMAYILMRIGLVGYLTSVAWKSLKSGSTLSLLLLGAGGLSILNGSFAQPTTLGFAVLTGGLCLAAAKEPEGEKQESPEPDQQAPASIPAPRIRGRSRYAEHLHR